MDSDKSEKRMNKAILYSNPEQVAKLFKTVFPDKFMYNANGWHINTENESYRQIEDGELRMFIDQQFVPLITDKKLLNKLPTNSFKHSICCELQSGYRI
jgi:hypothetical protein